MHTGQTNTICGLLEFSGVRIGGFSNVHPLPKGCCKTASDRQRKTGTRLD